MRVKDVIKMLKALGNSNGNVEVLVATDEEDPRAVRTIENILVEEDPKTNVVQIIIEM